MGGLGGAAAMGGMIAGDVGLGNHDDTLDALGTLIAGGPSTQEGRSAQQALSQIAPIWADAVNFTVNMLQLQAAAAQSPSGGTPGIGRSGSSGALCDGAVGRTLSKSSGRALV